MEPASDNHTTTTTKLSKTTSKDSQSGQQVKLSTSNRNSASIPVVNINEIDVETRGAINITENTKNSHEEGVLLSSANVNNKQVKAIEPPPNMMFLFVNPTSGGNQAAVFTKLSVEMMFLRDLDCYVYIYDLKDSQHREKGFNMLYQQQCRYPAAIFRVIVGGGDGTIIWIVQEMLAHAIKTDHCWIGIVPFGTGNDFARILGWGGKAKGSLIGKNLKDFKKLVKKFLKATKDEYDIWDVSVELFPSGSFKRISKNKKGFQKIELKDENRSEQNLRSLSKLMCNYISLGIDARIGYGFDKNRTTSALCNKGVYAWEGLKKMCCTSSQHVGDFLRSLELYQDRDTSLDDSDQEEEAEELFTTANGKTSQKEESKGPSKSTPILLGNPATLIGVNIGSYGGGMSDLWKNAKGRVGVSTTESNKSLKSAPQSIKDGAMEFVTFASPFRLAFENVWKGNARRVAQGQGPFKMNFRKPDSEDTRCYLNIDGEYWQLTNPKCIRIRLTDRLPKGKIKVLLAPS
eukprot:CAMPEP_0115037416 /NCGR_PEP_ID=MMETSP0216-20121206/42790_1 /TAXON_ID=223996 /ORGANISM="Protocruzia adherens, Strain Boccale" /LENGTH=516 /DNA_ID=CAMNT_0002417601 /DNA_START=314 /DNA_END=1864 /DNA_ORIENTATION=-